MADYYQGISGRARSRDTSNVLQVNLPFWVLLATKLGSLPKRNDSIVWLCDGISKEEQSICRCDSDGWHGRFGYLIVRNHLYEKAARLAIG